MACTCTYTALSLEGGDDLKEIVEVLDDDVMSKWKDIAVQLKISENSKRIELENPQSIRQQGVEMFKTWMKNAEPEECTRRTLLQALSSRTVGAKQLAKKLRRKWSSDSSTSMTQCVFCSMIIESMLEFLLFYSHCMDVNRVSPSLRMIRICSSSPCTISMDADSGLKCSSLSI